MNEGEEEEELLVWTVFLHLKAYLMEGDTVVREGMSADEDEWNEVLSRVMERGNSNDFPPSMMIVVSLGKSIRQFISPSPLRMTNSVDSS